MKGILATVICAVAAIYAATVFAENIVKEPEEKDFTPEFVAQCRARAEAGDAEAQVIYGTALANGWGVEKDLAKAAEWYTKAAKNGNAGGQVKLGVCYFSGRGVEKDKSKAIELWRNAAEQGNADAQCLLGTCYAHGTGVEKDMAKAVEWFTKAAEQGVADAQHNLGWCYEFGAGVEKDMAKAVEWYMKAAEQGDANAQCNLGGCYANGEGVEKNMAKAVEWYLKAVEQGNARAQNNLGVCYADGTGVEKDMAKAAEWFTKAAEQGVADAQHNLGACYADGEGVEKNMAKAVEWFTKAAEQGVADAQHNLGACYANGDGVEKDMAKAVEWYMKAAKQGDARAQCNLGVCYKNGDGVEKDVNKAAEWLGKASLQGNGKAVNILGEILDNHDFDSDIRANRETYEAALRVGREKLEKRWPKQRAKADARGWTTNDTERVWASAAEQATRTTTSPRFGSDEFEFMRSDVPFDGSEWRRLVKSPHFIEAKKMQELLSANEGEGILEAFGTRYMPNAYDYYQKCREKAIEREQILGENFPKGAESDSTGGATYAKVAKACARAVSEMYRRHDELCHFYLQHTIGIMTEAELVEADSRKICILLPRITCQIEEASGKAKRLDDKERTFAGKYLPETLVGYDRLANGLKDGESVYASLRDNLIKMDAVRANQELTPLRERLAEIRSMLNKLADTFKQQKLLHAVENVSSEDLADLDSKMALEIQALEKRLPVRDYVKTWMEKNWDDVCFEEVYVNEPLMGLRKVMVPLRGRRCAICKFEVTQALWEAVMGENPAEFKGYDRPVENVSPRDFELFIQKLNALPEIRESGMKYRLPTRDEWNYACLSGANPTKEDWKRWTFCKLSDGTEITEDTVGEVAWHQDNFYCRTHPVGRRKPNAFGFYDTIGNVEEFFSNGGGCYGRGGWSCGSSIVGNLWNALFDWNGYINDSGRDSSYKNRFLGFRLAADW